LQSKIICTRCLKRRIEPNTPYVLSRDRRLRLLREEEEEEEEEEEDFFIFNDTIEGV
jgi:hypothetical protein